MGARNSLRRPPPLPAMLSELLSPYTLQDAQPSQMVTEMDLMMGQVRLPGVFAISKQERKRDEGVTKAGLAPVAGPLVSLGMGLPTHL